MSGGIGVGGFLLALATAGALLHVAVRMKGIEVAYALGKERKLNKELEEERRRLHIEIGMLKDPDRIVELARDKLHMGPPAPGDILRGPPPAASGASAGTRVGDRSRREADGERRHPLDAHPARSRAASSSARCSSPSASAPSTCRSARASGSSVMAEEQYLREIELPPRRGRILDRNGAELASTADVDSIYCNPRRFVDVPQASRQLARVLGLDARELEKRLGQRRYFAWVKRKVTPDEVSAVRALALPGVAFTREPRRFYPNRGLAATVMGTSGSDGRGLDGVELSFDAYLRGSGSSVQGVRDALGRELFVESASDTTSAAGSDVVLTLDRYLTFVTERAIADAAAQHHAKAVVAVVMDPQTGEVLAMASVPSFNPNDATGAAEAGARDRAITDTFEPGSTMKTFTIAAALDAGVVRPDDRFDCLMGKMNVGKYTIHDTHAHGILTVAEVFKFSSNIGATKIARRLGRERLAGGARPLRLRASDRHRPAGRAHRRGPAGRQVGRHRLRQRLVRPGHRGDAAASDRRCVGHRGRRRLSPTAHRIARGVVRGRGRDSRASRRSIA